MSQHGSYILIYVTQLDIHLADSGVRSCVYAAEDQHGRLWAVKAYDAPTSHNSIDFVDYIRGRVPFQLDTIRTVAGEMFNNMFMEHLDRCVVRHEFIISQPHQEAEITDNNSLPYNPTYKGMIEKYFAAFDASFLLRLE